MIRPRLALATFTLMTLSASAGAHAAESAGILLAQAPSVLRDPGMYLQLAQVPPRAGDLPALGVDLVLGRRRRQGTGEPEVRDLEQCHFFAGVLGFAMIWAIPIYPISLTLLLLAYFVPLLSYVYSRNQMVPDDAKSLDLVPHWARSSMG